MLINMLRGLEGLPSLLIYKYEYTSANYHKTSPGQCEVHRAHRTPLDIEHRRTPWWADGARSDIRGIAENYRSRNSASQLRMSPASSFITFSHADGIRFALTQHPCPIARTLLRPMSSRSGKQNSRRWSRSLQQSASMCRKRRRKRRACVRQQKYSGGWPQPFSNGRERISLMWSCHGGVCCQWCHVVGASGSLSQCVLSFHSTASHGVSANNCCSVCHVNAASNWRSRASPTAESGVCSHASAALAARHGVHTWARQRVQPPLRMWQSGRQRCTRVRRWSRMRWTVRWRC